MKKAPKVLMWNCVQERGIKNNSGVKLHLRRRPQRLTWASSPRGEAEVRVWTQRTSGIRHDEESVDDEWRNREADVNLLSWIWPTSGGGLCWSHWNTSWVNSPQMSHWGRSGKQWERRGERRGGKGGGRREGVKDGWRTGWWRGCGVLGKTQVGKYLILLNFLLFSCLSFSFFVSLPFLLLFLLLLLQLLSSSVQNFNSCLSFACFLLRGLPFTHFPFLITILILHLYRIISVAPCWTLRGTTVLYLYRVVAFLQVASTLVLFSSGGVELTPPVHGLFSLTSTWSEVRGQQTSSVKR